MRGPDASFKGKEIWFHFETNPYDWFPKFEAVGESPFNFEGVFRHFVMDFSDSFWLQTSFKAYMGGLIHQKKWVATNFHRTEAHQRFRSRSQGVATAVSVFVKLNQNNYKYWDGNAV